MLFCWSRLSALIQRPEMEIIGVVIDADTNIRGRWQSIRDKLQNYPYVCQMNQNATEQSLKVLRTGRVSVFG